MSFLLKDTIHQTLAETLYNEILSRRSNYHYFIGKVMDWGTPSTPDTPSTNRQYEYDTRNHIIASKKISFTDVSMVVRRIDWTSGTVYDQYNGDYDSTFTSSTDAESLKDSDFYALTNEYNVYKCLFNNDGADSTDQPTGTDPIPVTYDDGYIWKYMYTIPLSLRNKFLTSSYMPVQTSVLNAFYSDGQIDSVIVDNPGSGYFGNAEVTLTVGGTFKSGNGNVVAQLTPIFNSNGQFISVVIDNAGNNYNTANITITDNHGTGTGYYNTSSTAVLTPVVYNGKIDRILIEDPGTDYSANIQTTITYNGDGTGAVLTPYINAAGELEDVIIENRGSGYTYLDIEIVGDGANANAYVNLSTGDLNTVQSTVELAAIDGAIYSIRVANVGDGYNTNATISVSGDGSGFSANVILDNTNNTVSYIEVLNPGSGYTYATASITAPYGANANVIPIIGPKGGHGSNAVKELFADAIMLYSTINNEKIHGKNVNNDYRQFGIIKDLEIFGDDTLYTGTTGTSCYLITVDDVQSLAADATLTIEGDTSKEFEVVEVYAATNQLLVTNLNNYGIAEGSILNDPDTDVTYIVQSVDETPTINKLSGDLLYIDNRTTVSYSDQQLVTLRTVIKL